MSKTFTCRELGGVCDQKFSGSTFMEVMQKAMPHMGSNDDHKAHTAILAENSGESKEDWMARMKKEFDARSSD